MLFSHSVITSKPVFFIFFGGIRLFLFGASQKPSSQLYSDVCVLSVMVGDWLLCAQVGVQGNTGARV